MIQKPKRKPRKSLVKALDKIFSEYIRARDKTCQIVGGCRCGGVLQCNHLVSRKCYRLRWDEKNALGGCAAHNTWAHYNQIEWYKLWRKLWPEKVKYLDIAEKQIEKIDSFKLEVLIAYYKEKMKRLNGNTV